MRAIRKFSKYLVLTLFVLSLFPSVAFAYLDPGTGSYLMQVLIGGVMGGMFAVSMFWRRIVAFFSNLFGRGTSKDNLADEPSKPSDPSE